ncbi:MAG: sugar nucleotide-binding protein [Candidatus Lokiarchaeota archaeon]|nr:sugar nucleotide-binding protein [Candidatus Lokiarchaeota archaeon]
MDNVLVLGTSGMLGSMVFDFLSNNSKFHVYGTVRNQDYLKENIFLFDANHIEQLDQKKFLDLEIDYIINCIGITKPFCNDDDPEGVQRAIKINVLFPWKLSEFGKKYDIRVIQICTDCVFSGKKGKYNENDPHDPLDVYGKSKSLGEVFDGSALLIRCSIIGPEMKNDKNFLLEWFLNQPKGGEIGGFAHHIWNGVTTLQFAKLCKKIIKNDKYKELIKNSHIYHFTPNNTINKFELMKRFNDIFKRDLKINRVFKNDETVDRSLVSKFEKLNKIYGQSNLKKALKELKNYIDESSTFNIS